MKLTKVKLLETIRRKNEGLTTYQARKIAGISIRRVNQIWKEYQETGKIPELGKRDEETLKKLFNYLKRYRGRTKLVLVDALRSYENLIKKYLSRNGHFPKVRIINKSKYMKEQQGFLT
jgi:IS1 family transposase